MGFRIHNGMHTLFRGRPAFMNPSNRTGTAHAVIDMGFGDGGKGTITDFITARLRYLRPNAEIIVVRHSGGAQAGHKVLDPTLRGIIFNQVPSGILVKGVIGFLSSRMLVDPGRLLTEIDKLKNNYGVDVKDRIKISIDASVVFPFHVALSRMIEIAGGANASGTIGRGVGQAAQDRERGLDIKISDLFNSAELSRKLSLVLPEKRAIAERLLAISPQTAEHFNAKDFDLYTLYYMYLSYGRTLKGNIVGGDYADQAYRKGASIVFEGSQGTLLDVQHGTQPYVTHTNVLASSISESSGINPRKIERVGVVRSYFHRFGPGPLPTRIDGTEWKDEYNVLVDDHSADDAWLESRRPVHNFAVGWLDTPALVYANSLNRVHSLAITNVDRLDAFRTLRICNGYASNNERVPFQPQPEYLAQVVPQYEELPGWLVPTSGVKRYENLPPNLRKGFLRRVRKLSGIPIGVVSVGPRRDQKIVV